MVKLNNYREYPHMGCFTRGSVWRITKDLFVDERGSFVRKGTEFTVAGGCQYGRRIIPVTDTSIRTFADRTSETNAGKKVTGSIMHDRIFRFVELVDRGHYPLLYAIRQSRSTGRDQFDQFVDAYAAGGMTTHIAQARFYERENAALKGLIHKSGWEKGWYGGINYDPKNLDVVVFDARTGEYEHHARLSQALVAYMNYLGASITTGDRSLAIADLVKANHSILYAGCLEDGNLLGKVETLNALRVKKRISFRGVHYRNLFFGDSQDNAIAAKLASPYPITLREFA